MFYLPYPNHIIFICNIVCYYTTRGRSIIRSSPFLPCFIPTAPALPFSAVNMLLFLKSARVFRLSVPLMIIEPPLPHLHRRPAKRYIFFSPETQAARSTIACSDCYDSFINKFHSDEGVF